MKPKFIVSVVAISYSLATTVPAADRYWDANGDTAATGGTGTWNASSTTTWRTGSDTGALGIWATGDNAIFGGTAGTVTVGAAVSAAGIKLLTSATGNYTISTTTTNLLTLSATTSVIDVASGKTLAFTGSASGSVIGGSNTATVQGGGTVTVVGTNRAFPGVFDVTGSGTTLKLSGTNVLDNASASTGVAVRNSGILEVNSVNNFRRGVTLGGASSSGGTLKLGNAAAFTMQNSSSLSSLGTSKSTILSTLANTGTTFGAFSGNGASRTFTVASTGDASGIDLEYSAGWKNGTLAKAGAGVMRLNPGFIVNASNDYTTTSNTVAALNVSAGTFINEGTVKSMTTISGGTVKTGTASGTFDIVNLNSGTFEVASPSAIFATGVTYATDQTAFNFKGGTLKYSGVNTDLSSYFSNLGSAGIAVDTNGNDVTFASSLNGSGRLTKKGAGKLTLVGSHALTGDLVIEGGAVVLAATASLPTTSITLKETGTLDTTALSAGYTFSASGFVLANDTFHDDATNSVKGDLTLGSGTFLRPGGKGVIKSMSFNGNFVLGGTYEVDLNNSYNDSLQVSGNVDLTNASVLVNLLETTPSSSTLLTYGGTLTGMPELTGNLVGSRYNPRLVHNVGGKSVDLSISSGSGPLALTWTGSVGTAWDSVTEEKNFVKNTSAVADTFKSLDTLTFNDTATGSTLVVLSGQIAPGSLLFDHSLLSYTLSGTGSIAGPTALTKTGTGTLTLATDNGYTGGTQISAGQINVGNGGSSGSIGSGDITNDGVLRFARDGALTISQSIFGLGSLVVDGPGVITLAGSNLYSGGTSILAGTLKLGNAAALGLPSGTTLVSVAQGGALDINGNSLISSSLSVVAGGDGLADSASGAIVNSGAAIANGGIKNLVLSGDIALGSNGARYDITGAITSTDSLVPRKLTKVGTSQIALKATDYSGVSEIQVDGGILGLENSANLSTAIPVNVGASGRLQLWGGTLNFANTLNLNGGTLNPGGGTLTWSGPVNINSSARVEGTVNLTISGLISGSGTLTKSDSGKLILPIANNYDGNTLIEGTGVLEIQNNNALGTAGSLRIHGASGSQLALGSSGLDFSRPIALGNSGRTGEGAIYYNQTSGSATLSGPITLSGAHTSGGTFGSAEGGELIVTGKITQAVSGLDTGMLVTATEAAVRVALRTGRVRFSNPQNDFESLYVSTGTLVLGVENGLSTTAVVNLGDTTTLATLDLNGFNQELRSIARWTSTGSTGSTTLTNTSTVTPAEFTFNTDYGSRRQVESSLAQGVPNANGNVKVTITGAGTGLTGTGVILNVPVLSGDTPAAWAQKVREALSADPVISALYSATGTDAVIALTQKTAGTNDNTLIFKLENGSPSPAITADTTSSNSISAISNSYVGSITGNLSLRKKGPDALTLSGTHTHTGGTTVAQGKLILNSTHTGGGAYSVNAGATLAGTGSTASAVTVSGTISPADASIVGALSTGPLSFSAGSNLAVDINTTSLTSDSLRVTGTVSTEAGAVNLLINDLGGNGVVSVGTKLLLASHTLAWTGSLTYNGTIVAEGATVQVGVNRFKVSYNDTTYPAVANGLTLTAVVATTAFEDWWAAYPGVALEFRGAAGDPDADGLSNLLEFAFGTSPADAASRPANSPVIVTDGVGRYLTLTVPVRAGASFSGSPLSATRDGLIYRVLGSNDLTNDSSLVESTGVPGSPPAAPLGYEYKAFRLASPISTQSKGFLRLKVEQATP